MSELLNIITALLFLTIGYFFGEGKVRERLTAMQDHLPKRNPAPVGPINRPDAKKLMYQKNPHLKDEEDEMRRVLDQIPGLSKKL